MSAACLLDDYVRSGPRCRRGPEVVLRSCQSVSQLGDGGEGRARRTVRLDDAPVRQDLAGVLEDDDTVAQQAPALARMRGDHVSCVVVGSARGRAVRLVGTHSSLTFGLSVDLREVTL